MRTLFLILALQAAAFGQQAVLWQPVKLSFQGPATSEKAAGNPFLDYRLTVTLTHAESGTVLTVPGYYAADGNAAESSADSGRVWQAHFLPVKTGSWEWKASFRKGTGVAISTSATDGEEATVSPRSGTIQVTPTPAGAKGFHAKGLLQYEGSHYLRFAGSGERFLKGGADSPENFLAYGDFDGTFDTDANFNEGRNTTGKAFVHSYTPHAGDWRPGDPLWQKSKGRSIIGALNYLAGKGMNSVYFLTYNIDTGDGKDVWPWISAESRDRFDVSKLSQWEVVFSHMDRLGLMLHVVTQETENDHKLGGGPGLNPIRKLYLRELVARFSHHLALIWNLGEENNTPESDRKEIAAWIRALDPYKHPITVHTHVNRIEQCYSKLYGHEAFEATSIQADMNRYHRYTLETREASTKAGRKWVIFGDEQTHADTGVLPDSADPGHDIPRKDALWGNLMAGGAGVEWYFGYKHAHMDLNCEDWRSRDRMWDQTRHALEFFQKHLPFHEMEPSDRLADGVTGSFVLAKPGSVYAVYLPHGGNAALRVSDGEYSVQWFDPRNGGVLREGTVKTITARDGRLGLPPDEIGQDWVVLVKRK